MALTQAYLLFRLMRPLILSPLLFTVLRPILTRRHCSFLLLIPVLVVSIILVFNVFFDGQLSTSSTGSSTATTGTLPTISSSSTSATSCIPLISLQLILTLFLFSLRFISGQNYEPCLLLGIRHALVGIAWLILALCKQKSTININNCGVINILFYCTSVQTRYETIVFYPSQYSGKAPSKLLLHCRDNTAIHSSNSVLSLDI